MDEIRSRKEVLAVESAAQRGVAVVATAHGVCLNSLLMNPELNLLLGVLGTVTLGDAASR